MAAIKRERLPNRRLSETRPSPALPFCHICGSAPCVNPSFCALCRRADAKHRGGNDGSAITRTRRLLHDNVSLDAIYRGLNDARSRPTPQTTIEAILYCVRERSFKALDEPYNIERLRRCDEAALAQINTRIVKLKEDPSQ
jgi:hypothetical protein